MNALYGHLTVLQNSRFITFFIPAAGRCPGRFFFAFFNHGACPFISSAALRSFANPIYPYLLKFFFTIKNRRADDGHLAPLRFTIPLGASLTEPNQKSGILQAIWKTFKTLLTFYVNIIIYNVTDVIRTRTAHINPNLIISQKKDCSNENH